MNVLRWSTEKGWTANRQQADPARMNPIMKSTRQWKKRATDRSDITFYLFGESVVELRTSISKLFLYNSMLTKHCLTICNLIDIFRIYIINYFFIVMKLFLNDIIWMCSVEAQRRDEQQTGSRLILHGWIPSWKARDNERSARRTGQTLRFTCLASLFSNWGRIFNFSSS